jgi:hypothetical protein
VCPIECRRCPGLIRPILPNLSSLFHSTLVAGVEASRSQGQSSTVPMSRHPELVSAPSYTASPLSSASHLEPPHLVTNAAPFPVVRCTPHRWPRRLHSLSRVPFSLSGAEPAGDHLSCKSTGSAPATSLR